MLQGKKVQTWYVRKGPYSGVEGVTWFQLTLPAHQQRMFSAFIFHNARQAERAARYEFNPRVFKPTYLYHAYSAEGYKSERGSDEIVASFDNVKAFFAYIGYKKK